MQSLSTNLTWSLANPKWAQTLNPVLRNPLVNGQLLPEITLINGVNTFNHLLSRNMQGWIITDIQAPAEIYRSAPLNNETLTLTSNANTVISLWVF